MVHAVMSVERSVGLESRSNPKTGEVYVLQEGGLI